MTAVRPVRFIYGSQPSVVAATIDIAVARLRLCDPSRHWSSWREVATEGRVIPHELTRWFDDSAAVVADLTTLNENVAFEVAVALARDVPIIPIRDVSYGVHQGFGRIGLLDTVACVDFRNADDLVGRLPQAVAKLEALFPKRKPSPAADLLVVNGAFDTEGFRQAIAAIKSAAVSHTVLATTGESHTLETLMTAAAASSAVIVLRADPARTGVYDLLEPARRGVVSENARGIFVAGLASGMDKPVLILQEGLTAQPVDCRNLVSCYSDPGRVPAMLEGFLTRLIDSTSGNVAADRDGDPRQLLDRLGADRRRVWNQFCAPLVDGVDSYAYVEARTGDRPGEFDAFVRLAAEIAGERNATRVMPADLRRAEEIYSRRRLDEARQRLTHDDPAAAVLRWLHGVDAILPAAELRAAVASSVGEESLIPALARLMAIGVLEVWSGDSETGCLSIASAFRAALHVKAPRAGGIWPQTWSVG